MRTDPSLLDKCRRSDPPPCSVACPFHLDVRDFIKKMKRGSFNAAFRMFRDVVVFPETALALCGQGCQGSCPAAGGPVNMPGLEQACLALTTKAEPDKINMPRKTARIAVVGAGLNGLACTLRLAKKKYDVTLYEKTDRLGGRLWEALPPEVFLPDIERQFKYEQYTAVFSREVLDLGCLAGEGYDAIYIATGGTGPDWGVDLEQWGSFRYNENAGLLVGSSAGGAEAIRQGTDAVRAIEDYLQIHRFFASRSGAQPDSINATKYIMPQYTGPAGLLYDETSAKAEAERCTGCFCQECLNDCLLMRERKKYPPEIQKEVLETVEPGSFVVRQLVATRMIAGCDDCGLCAQKCPEQIDMGKFFMQARIDMEKDRTLPWPYHDFWMRDLEFAQSDQASLRRLPHGEKSCRRLFFPGCQLGASEPAYVYESYKRLLELDNKTGLLLQCCGVPAKWAGRENDFLEILAAIRKYWQAFGRPELVVACPNCGRVFREYLPEIPIVSLYDILPLPKKASAPSKQPIAVFDPCSSRHDPALQQRIREITAAAGYDCEELLHSGSEAVCCGWGGHMSLADPELAQKELLRCTGQSELPYLTYCQVCRDNFLNEGKDSKHVLDLLLNLDITHAVPGFSQKRANRLRLHRDLLRDFWGEAADIAAADMPLRLSKRAIANMERDMILDSDILQVITEAEKSGRKFQKKGSQLFIAGSQVGNFTVWVEYEQLEDEYSVANAYVHRMKLEK